jgi:SAM-dependent methyltransferase
MSAGEGKAQLMIHLYNTAAQTLAREIVQRAEANGSSDPMPVLRELCLTDFGELILSMPAADLPNLSAKLAALPEPSEQAIWTGASGRELLQDSLSFTRIVTNRFEKLTDKDITKARVLDYGCGFGRLLRMFNYYVDKDNLFGIDPWDRSVAICKQYNVPANVVQSDFLPTGLPLEGAFDLMYSYSVFTHTSERATKAALKSLRKYAGSGTVLAMTIREVEFWRHWAPAAGFTDARIEEIVASHHTVGFAFEPINLEPVDGDITFGNTSMTLAWLAQNLPEWKVVGYDRGIDYTQTILFLQPN